MNYRLASIVVVLIFGLILPLKCAAIYHRQYTVTDGLPSNTVYHVVRDHNGFLWFCTDKGIAKFDGKTFKIFGVAEGLGDNVIFHAFEDRENRLWVSTYNGSNCFIRNDSVINSSNDSLLRRLPVMPWLNGVLELADGTTILGYNRGQIIGLKGKSWKWINSRVNRFGNLSFITSHENTVYSYIGNILLKTTRRDNSITRFTENIKVFYSNGKWLTVGDSGIKVFDNSHLIYHRKGERFNRLNVNHLLADKAGGIYVSMSDGLVVLRGNPERDLDLLKGVKVTSCVEDIAGNIWVTTIGLGVFMINKELERIVELPDPGQGIVTYSGAGQLFFKRGDSVFFLTKALNWEFIRKNIAPHTEPVFHSKRIFISSNLNGGMSYLMSANGKIDSFSSASKAVYVASDSELLIVGFRAIYSVVSNGNEIKVSKAVEFPEKIQLFTRTDKGNIYVITSNTLVEYSRQFRRTKTLDLFTNSQYSIAGLFSVDNKLLLQTNDRHLIFYSLDDYSKKVIGNLGNVLYSVKGIGGIDYLVTTNWGCYFLRLNLQTPPKTVFEKIEDPIQQASTTSLYPVYGNLIIIDDGMGLFAFNPAIVNLRAPMSKVFINNISVNGRSFGSTTSIGQTGINSAHINIDLGSLYFSTSTVGFEYRMRQHGSWNDWMSLSGEQADFYLRHGNYHIQIRSHLSSESDFKDIYLSLSPPFYNSTTFYIVFFVFCVGLAFFSLNRYKSAKQVKLQKQLEFVQMENQATNALFNPHFIFNAIGNIQGLIITGSRDKANVYLTRLSKLIRQNLDNLQHEIVLLSSELELVKSYAAIQNLRFDNLISLHIEASLLKSDVKVPPLLIHTFIENSIIHGFKGSPNVLHITITETTFDGSLIVVISDDGKGSAANDIHNQVKTSLGIQFVTKRLHRINQIYRTNFHFETASSTAGYMVKIYIDLSLSARLNLEV